MRFNIVIWDQATKESLTDCWMPTKDEADKILDDHRKLGIRGIVIDYGENIPIIITELMSDKMYYYPEDRIT